ncbi:methionyl-tRNA formyltransferase [Anaeromicropila herbilytica]|nr:methionyl-tRNA formyltransferase [Anaeromicropila herbilytica]
MKVIFMGTPDFSVRTLEKIIEAGHEVLAVMTQPDKPKGRGKAVAFPPVKEKALEHNIPVYQPIKVREEEYVNIIRELNPDVIVTVAFGQILPESILNIPKYGCINVHASLLPKYRGAAPIQWAVIDGEKESGVTTMYMAKGIDTGDMILKAVTPIEKDETYGSLHDKLAVLGADLLVETLVALENGTAIREEQDDSLSNYVVPIDKTLGHLDFNKSAIELERLIRGLNPVPSAYTFLDNKKLKVWKAEVVPCKEGKEGEIVQVTKDSIIIKTKEDGLALKEIQLEGKKRMEVTDFLRGYNITVGTVL